MHIFCSYVWTGGGCTHTNLFQDKNKEDTWCMIIIMCVNIAFLTSDVINYTSVLYWQWHRINVLLPNKLDNNNCSEMSIYLPFNIYAFHFTLKHGVSHAKSYRMSVCSSMYNNLRCGSRERTRACVYLQHQQRAGISCCQPSCISSQEGWQGKITRHKLEAR